MTKDCGIQLARISLLPYAVLFFFSPTNTATKHIGIMRMHSFKTNNWHSHSSAHHYYYYGIHSHLLQIHGNHKNTNIFIYVTVTATHTDTACSGKSRTQFWLCTRARAQKSMFAINKTRIVHSFCDDAKHQSSEWALLFLFIRVYKILTIYIHIVPAYI